MEERDYLYLKGTEELGDVIEILKDFQGDEIVLVVPVGTKALSHPVNIDLLKKEFFKKRHKIYFSTEDKKISDLLKVAGFNVFLEEYENSEELHRIVTDIIVPSKLKPKIRKPLKTAKAPKTNTKFKVRLSRWSIIAVVLILLAGAVAFGLDKFTSRATITITLKSESKDFKEMLEIKSQALNNDLQNQILKGEKIELVKTHTVIIPATGEGKGGNRAKGELTLSNSSSNQMTLIAGTRFKTSDERIFRATQRVSVPTKEDGGKVVFEVIADETGEKYNVSAKTEFTIPGLAGTHWEKEFTTIAENRISGGGSSGETKIVTNDDISGGIIKIEKEIKEIIVKELKIKYPDYIFPEDGGSVNISQPDISHKVGQATDRIVFSGKGDIKTIGVKKENLVNFIKDIIADKNLKEQSNVRIAGIDIESFRVMDIDPKSTFIKAQVSGKVTIKGNIDSSAISKQLAGKSLENVKDMLKDNPAIENAEASIWPFWNNKLPTNSDKIDIRVK